MKIEKADLWALVVPILMVGGAMGLYVLVAASNLISAWLSTHPLVAIVLAVAALYAFVRFVR